MDSDRQIRLDAFAQLDRLTARFGLTLPWAALDSGFNSGGRVFRFASIPRGIFRPSGMSGGALSLKTVFTPDGKAPRYEDVETPEGYFLYRLQGDDADAYDNRWLRTAHELRAPLVYFRGIAKGRYHAIYPVVVMHLHPGQLSCELAVVEREKVFGDPVDYAAAAWEGKRRYATYEARRRLHQDQFRHYVLQAYSEKCAICRIPRPELLDAAHILADRQQGSRVEIPNGLALCQLHHRAYDRNLLGIRPDSVVELSPTLLKTRDGPTFEEAFLAFHERPVHAPRRPEDRPRKVYLETRYQEFLDLNR